MEVGQLVTPNDAGAPQNGNALSDIVISGGAVFAGAPLATVSAQEQGAVFVYPQPVGGWSGGQQATAELVASAPLVSDGLGGSVSVSGQTVVAGSQPTGPFTDRMFVFTEPAGGWSGIVHEAAILTAGAGIKLEASAISGSTIVADGYNTANGRGAVYVFTEPTGGWSGMVHDTATLAGGSFLLSMAGATVVAGGTISGRTVVAPAGDAYVFTEPKGGWSGTLQPAATLKAILSGAANVFTEPHRGWSGVVHPSALLTLDGDRPVNIAISGSTIALEGPHPGRNGCFCDAGLGLFSEPTGGWAGELTASQSLSTTQADGNGSIPLAIDGQTLFAGGQPAPGTSIPGLYIFSVSQPIPQSPPGPPSVDGTTITGLADGKPRLKFRLSAGTNAAPIQSVTITVPTGLSFSHGRKQLARGVSGLVGTGVDKYTLTATGNRLKVALSGSVKRIPLTIGVPALKESKALIKKRPRKLDILLRVVDGIGRTSALHMTIVVR